MRGAIADPSSGRIARIWRRLHAIASKRMRTESRDHALTPTALVNEAYVRCGSPREIPQLRTQHAVRLVSKSMGNVLIDAARRAGRTPRREFVAEADLVADSDWLDVFIDRFDLDAAIDDLWLRNPRHARIVELRKDSDLTNDEIAECVGISPRGYYREWERIQHWLTVRLQADDDE